MTKRVLYIGSYDICHPGRLKKALDILRDYSCGGQYSCFECYLSDVEKQQLIARMNELMASGDGFMLIRLSHCDPVHTLGAAVPPQNGEFFLVGY